MVPTLSSWKSDCTARHEESRSLAPLSHAYKAIVCHPPKSCDAVTCEQYDVSFGDDTSKAHPECATVGKDSEDGNTYVPCSARFRNSAISVIRA